MTGGLDGDSEQSDGMVIETDNLQAWYLLLGQIASPVLRNAVLRAAVSTRRFGQQLRFAY